MAATGKTPILLYGSTTATNQPSAGNLTNSSDGCEIAINVADKNLFFKDSTNTVNTVPIRQSSASSNGWLSSTDWTTFNSKQPAGTYVTSVTGTAPVVSSGGTTPAISMAAASGSVNGYLTSTDWTTFNNKVSSQWVTTGSNIYYTAGLVGIGNTSPTAALDVSYGLASTASPVTYLSAANANDATAVEIRQGRYNKDALVITSNQTLSANFIRVSENGTDRFIVAGGGVGDVTVSTGNLVIGTSGKGIDFSATAGTGTSELLADYEEGTWTPTDQSGAGLTFTVNYAHYVKVGSVVTINAYFSFPATASTANVQIGGLPYTIGSGNYCPGAIITNAAVNSAADFLAGSSNFYVVNPAGATLYTNVTFAGGYYLLVSGTYIV